MRKKEKTCESLENASKSLNIYLKTPVLFNRETGVFNTVINNFFISIHTIFKVKMVAYIILDSVSFNSLG